MRTTLLKDWQPTNPGRFRTKYKRTIRDAKHAGQWTAHLAAARAAGVLDFAVDHQPEAMKDAYLSNAIEELERILARWHDTRRLDAERRLCELASSRHAREDALMLQPAVATSFEDLEPWRRNAHIPADTDLTIGRVAQAIVARCRRQAARIIESFPGHRVRLD